MQASYGSTTIWSVDTTRFATLEIVSGEVVLGEVAPREIVSLINFPPYFEEPL